jgi:hypothetical protein
MQYPAFFDAVPSLRMRDPLAQFLGVNSDGLIEYSYLDAVKLAGHSCPTVASAYWLTHRALAALYGDELPERGGVRVESASARQSGVSGVVASVATLLTGASDEAGFKGLAGRFARHGLLTFAVPDLADGLTLRFTRVSNQACVIATANPGNVPADPMMGPLLQRCLAGNAGPGEAESFATLWQARVRRLLLEHATDPAVFEIALCA